MNKPISILLGGFLSLVVLLETNTRAATLLAGLLPAQPTARDFARLPIAGIPLKPIGGIPNDAENRDLAATLESMAGLRGENATVPLEKYLEDHPQSPWRISILANLGTTYRKTGRWTQALTAWSEAWRLGKMEKNPELAGVVDGALVGYSELLARLGRVNELEKLVQEAGARSMSGAATEKWADSKMSLYLEKTDPTKAFRCGPYALSRILAVTQPKNSHLKELLTSTCTAQGTSLLANRDLSIQWGLDYQVAYRTPGAAIIIPAVVHWKVGHFAAITKPLGNGYLIEDPTFTDEIAVTGKTLDQEASGYFLVPKGSLPKGWTKVSDQVAATIWGKGQVPPPPNVCPPDERDDCDICKKLLALLAKLRLGMAEYSMDAPRVDLNIYDIPLFYQPSRGPSMAFYLSYSQRDTADNSTIPNAGHQWNMPWASYVQIFSNYFSGGSSIVSATMLAPGGGQKTYTSYVSSGPNSGQFARDRQDQSILYRRSASVYERVLPDGSKYVYDNLTSDPLSLTTTLYMTAFYDAQGNKITYNWSVVNGQIISGASLKPRLLSVTDAIGQNTILAYQSDDDTTPNYFHIAAVTDPFGRQATLQYDTAGLLWKITDPVGIVSEFTYGTGNFINKMTTPYGMTTFVSTDVNADRTLQITDPMGASEKLDFKFNMVPPDCTAANPVPVLPAGPYAFPDYYNYRNTYYWDKKAFSMGADESNPDNFKNAKLTHWTHSPDAGGMDDFVESEKEPLESHRVFYDYPGSNNPIVAGTIRKPSAIARVLDDGTTQVVHLEYNALGNVTKSVDPLGRTTTFQYDSTGVDLLDTYQENPNGASTDSYGQPADKLSEITYNSLHLPLTVKNASRLETDYSYNSFGQPLTVKNAKNEITTYSYNNNYLTDVTGPVSGATEHFDYDSFGRLWKTTNSDGDITTLEYDAIGGDPKKSLNRLAKNTFPDGTYTQITYDLLDAEWLRDRQGRWSRIWVDLLRRKVAEMDPLNRLTQYSWCSCGSLESLTDPAGNLTTWVRDGQKRLVAKYYGTTLAFSNTYEISTSRLQTVTDNAGQQTNYSYFPDDSLNTVSYTNATIATPSVSYLYDPVYPRMTSMTDGTGTTSYAYNPITGATSLGAGQLYSIDGPLANDLITFNYDELGRETGQAINGVANQSSVLYDALGRVQNLTNPLGGFAYSYVNQTGRVSSVSFPNGQETDYAYWDAAAAPAGTGNSDRRLKEIKNVNKPGSTPAILSQFDYSYNADGSISSWSRTASDASQPQHYDFAYDAADQLTSSWLRNSDNSVAKEQHYSYDLAGNRTLNQIATTPVTDAFNSLNQLTGLGTGQTMTFTGTVSKPATVVVGGQTAQVDPASGNWSAETPVATGSNTIPMTATDQSGNVTSKNIQVSVPVTTSQGFFYDANGNLTSDGLKSYEWDALHRMVAINYLGTSPAQRTEFTYDGVGNRVAILEKSGGTVTSEKHFVFLGTDIAEERDGANHIMKRFYGMGFQVIDPQTSTPTSYFYARDNLGSIREVTNSAGTLSARYRYDNYGARAATFSPLLVDADFGFTGQYQHMPSSLTLFWAREYDPATARWLSRDPIGEEGGINLYGYVGNDPVNGVDWMGLAIRFPANYDPSALMAYLSRSPQAKMILDYFNGPGGPNVWVKFTTYPGDFFQAGQFPVIIWNPDYTLKIYPDGSNTPYLAFLHELLHALHCNFNPKKYLLNKKDTTSIDPKRWTNREEYDTIQAINVIAIQLKETPRQGH